MKGAQRRISLGQYPILGVNQARETAIDVLQKSLLGTDARVVRNEALLALPAVQETAATEEQIEHGCSTLLVRF
jgi:hypothetical protein